MSSEEPAVSPIGHYTPWVVKEIPDNELDEQLNLFLKEKERRQAIEDEGRQIDEFFKRQREVKGIQPIGRGEEWFEPADVFDAYPLGAHVTYEGEHYRSKRHANMQPPTMRLWWEKITPPDPAPQQ